MHGEPPREVTLTKRTNSMNYFPMKYFPLTMLRYGRKWTSRNGESMHTRCQLTRCGKPLRSPVSSGFSMKRQVILFTCYQNIIVSWIPSTGVGFKQSNTVKHIVNIAALVYFCIWICSYLNHKENFKNVRRYMFGYLEGFPGKNDIEKLVKIEL